MSNNFPNSQDYMKAFLSIESEIKPIQKKMLMFNYQFPGHAITAREMANAIGYPNYKSANLHYGKLAKLLCVYFNREFDCYLRIIVKFHKPFKSELKWVFHPQVCDALERLNWVKIDFKKSKYKLREDFNEEFNHQIKKSFKDSGNTRRLRLKNAPKIPETIQVIQTTFKKNLM